MISLVEPLFNKILRQYQNSPHTHTKTQIHRKTKSNQTLNKFKYVTKTNYSPNMVAALSQLQQIIKKPNYICDFR